MTRQKTAREKSSEIDAIAKSSDNRGLGEGFSGVGDAEIGSKEHDEASNDDLLGLKAMKQLVSHQPGRGATKAGGGGGAEPEGKERPTENGAKARTMRKLGFCFALRERGRKHG